MQYMSFSVQKCNKNFTKTSQQYEYFGVLLMKTHSIHNATYIIYLKLHGVHIT